VILVVLSGTFGMVTFLVAERTRQIGMRRALGATRRDVVRYFLLENWVLTSLGLVAGLPLAYGLNILARLAQPDLYLEWPPLALGVLLFWLTGELATLVPALRAANVPPTVATRTV
jgi:putative ABC transport system permease protein